MASQGVSTNAEDVVQPAAEDQAAAIAGLQATMGQEPAHGGAAPPAKRSVIVTAPPASTPTAPPSRPPPPSVAPPSPTACGDAPAAVHAGHEGHPVRHLTSQTGSDTTSGTITPVKGDDSDNDNNATPSEDGSECGGDADSKRPAGDAAAAELAANGLPSIGSALHASGECKRCCFYLKGRCHNGVNCQFCHLQHEKRSRGRGCRGHGTSSRMESTGAAVAAPPLALPPIGQRAPPGLDTQGLVVPPPAHHSAAPPGLAPPPPHPVLRGLIAATPTRPPPPSTFAPLQLPPLRPPREVPEEKKDVPPPPENSPSGLWTAGPLTTIFPVATDLAGVCLPVPPAARVRPGGGGGCLLSTPAPAGAGAEAPPASPWAATSPPAVPPTLPPPPCGVPGGESPALAAPLKGPPAASPIFGTTPVPPGSETLPRLLGYGGRMCATAGAAQKPAAAVGGVQGLAAGAAAVPLLGPPQHAAMAPPGLVKADKLFDLGTVPAKEGTMLVREMDEQLTHAHGSRPVKVFMSDYACSVPALDPRVPVKKRLPEWTLS